MTARELIREMQLHIVKHPEAADLPIRFEGCTQDEDMDGNLIDIAEIQCVDGIDLRVDLPEMGACFWLRGR